MLTFVLFRLAAGDPAAAVLGKNPSPREVEDLRNELGSNLPILYGHWCRTETFTSANFAGGTGSIPGIQTEGEVEPGRDGLLLNNSGKVVFSRNFDLPDTEIMCIIKFTGKLTADGRNYDSGDTVKDIELKFASSLQALSIAHEGQDSAKIMQVDFFRRQKSPFNSQLFNAVQEIVTFKSSFPYISFFNFGRTLITREPIKKILWRGVWPSLFLMLPIFFGELLLGIILALFSTAFKGCWIDRVIVLLSIAGMSISYLVFIIFGQWYLGYYFNIFPVWGWGDLRHLALPVMIGIASGLGGGVRFYRTVFVNELNREYLRTAEAKGCGTFCIFGKHLLHNAMIPIITRATAALPFLFTGSLLLERFFGIPGLGYAGLDALDNSDLQLLKALVIISALLFLIMNLLADIAYAWFDPRVRLKK